MPEDPTTKRLETNKPTLQEYQGGSIGVNHPRVGVGCSVVEAGRISFGFRGVAVCRFVSPIFRGERAYPRFSRLRGRLV